MARIALIVDNPFRDLPGLALVAAHLTAGGATVHLVPMARQDVELRALAPDGVLLNYLRPSNARLARDLVRAGVKIAVLDTEGGVLADVGVYDRAMLADSDVRDAVALYCSWGPVLAEHLRANGWFREDQIVVTGTPRFDFYSPTWRSAALAASPYADVVPPPMVLVNGNFSLANPQFQTSEEELRMLIESFGEDPVEARAWQDRDRAALEQLSGAVVRMAGDMPEVTFVYRPHPFERVDTYEPIFRGIPNIRLEKRGTVDGWILRASAVVQRTCTTALEAAMAGVAPLSPEWIPSPYPVPAADSASVPCGSVEEMESAIQQAISRTLVIPHDVRTAAESTIADWFRAADGDSGRRVAEALLDRVPARPIAERLEASRAIGGPDASAALGARLVAAGRTALKSSLPPEAAHLRRGRSEKPWQRSNKRFRVEEVRQVVERITACAPAIGRLGVEPARSDYVRFIRFGGAVTVRRQP